jgi:hypothetical protein
MKLMIFWNKLKLLSGIKQMVNANTDIYEMSHEESVSYFKRLENLKKIRHTNGSGPAAMPLDIKKFF